MNDNPDLLTAEQAAAILKIPKGTLGIWRSRNKGPAYVKYSAGRRGSVRYTRQAILDWLQARTRQPESLVA
jgi:hypothetical protein